MILHKPVLLVVLFILTSGILVSAETPSKKRIGLIASLSGFAAPYGMAVKDGVELAVSEINLAGENIELFIEDDQSDPAKIVSAYRFLKHVKKIDLLIGGSWWIRSVIQITEKDRVPLLSCETMYDKDFQAADTYFIMSGSVTNWVTVYEDFFTSQGFKRGAVLRFTSGFGQSIADEMKRLFSLPGREFVGDFQYQDLQLSPQSILMKLKSAAPDVVYIDAQPEGLASFLKRRAELGMNDMRIVGHTSLESAVVDKLVTPDQMKNVYFLKRTPPSSEFSKRFEAKFGYSPKLNADLGYYSMQMGISALNSFDPLKTLRQGMTIHSTKVVFDEEQVAGGVPHEIFSLNDGGEVIAVQKDQLGLIREEPKKLD